VVTEVRIFTAVLNCLCLLWSTFGVQSCTYVPEGFGKYSLGNSAASWKNLKWIRIPLLNLLHVSRDTNVSFHKSSHVTSVRIKVVYTVTGMTYLGSSKISLNFWESTRNLPQHHKCNLQATLCKRYQLLDRLICSIFIALITCMKYYQSFIYSPTDAPVSCLKKNNIKIYIKTASTCFGFTVTPSSGSVLICAY